MAQGEKTIMKLFILIFYMFLTYSYTYAETDTFSGNYFIKACPFSLIDISETDDREKVGENMWNSGLCLGFIRGVIDTADVYQQTIGRYLRNFSLKNQ